MNGLDVFEQGLEEKNSDGGNNEWISPLLEKVLPKYEKMLRSDISKKSLTI